MVFFLIENGYLCSIGTYSIANFVSIPTVGDTVTVKLDDSNYVTWNFQIELLLDGNGIFGFLDGSIPCSDKPELDSDAYTVWRIHDKALMTLITATLSTAVLSCVIGCKSSQEMWTSLRERFANMSRSSIVQMKIDLQNIRKGPESIDVYLQMIKDARDHLAAVGVVMSDEEIAIVALRGLPPEYNTIKSIIHGRETLVSLKELRSQLKAEEDTLNEVTKQVPLMSAMMAHSSTSTYDTGGTSGTKADSCGHTSGHLLSYFPASPSVLTYAVSSTITHSSVLTASFSRTIGFCISKWFRYIQ